MNGDQVVSAKVVLGHVAPVPWPSEEAAAALTGKAVSEEKVILTSLLKGLEQARQLSVVQIEKENRLTQELFHVLTFAYKDKIDEVNPVSDSLFYEILWEFETNVPVIGSYFDIKNTGKAVLISNADIRERFSNLELAINRLKGYVDDRLTVQQLRIDDIAEDKVNFVRFLNVKFPIDMDKEIPNDYSVILNDQNIRNLLAIKLELTESTLENRKTLLQQIEELIALIEKELKLNLS